METMTDADYADDLALLVNTLAQAEFLLHSREQAAGGIVLYVNAYKNEWICFKQKETISTLSGITYFGSSISFIERFSGVMECYWQTFDHMEI